MIRSLISKSVILFTMLSGVIFSFTYGNAQSEFPRISFIDPYWVHLNSALGNENTNFADSSYYWPQMERCGFTHSVTEGDDSSLTIPDTLCLLNSNLGHHKVWQYANGVSNEYPVGGILAGESYFALGEAAEDVEDEGRDVFRMLSGTDSSGVVLDGTFGVGNQLWGRNYWFIFTMKMVGDTSVSDSVARVHIWETGTQSGYYEGEHGGLMWREDLVGGEKDTTDITVIIYYDDFSDTGEYVDVKLGPIWLYAWQNNTHITFEWLGHQDLYIDHLWVRDSWNYELIVLQDDSAFTFIQETLESIHNINPARNYRFYSDEPHSNQYESYAKVNDLSKESPGVPLNGATAHRNFDQLTDFVSTVDPYELLYNEYTIVNYIDTLSSGQNSIQTAWDKLIYQPDGSSYRGMRAAAEVAKNNNIPFWMTIQVCKETRWDTTAQSWWCRYRAPTRNEIFAEANLALCYGAKGIMYFTYPSMHSINSDSTFGETYFGLVDLVDANDDTTWDYTTGRYVPNYRWYAVQEINTKMDSLADVLLNLNWQDAFISNPDTIISHATFVESLYSKRFVPDSTYIEIGIFESGETDYLMLVNRRCLSTEKDTIAVWIDTVAQNIQVLYDVYEQHNYPGTHGEFSNIPLDPGEGKLFELANTFRVSGSITENTTWEDDYTYSIIGDVTIEPGVTLTIEPGTTIKFSTTDNQSSGKDSNKSELIINGTLIANGTSVDSINFTSSSTSPSKSDWFGIVFEDATCNASEMSHCKIEFAVKGIYCYQCSVEVTSTRVTNCAYGAFVDASGTKLRMIDVTCRGCSYGAYVKGAANLKNCNFNYNNYGISCYGSVRYWPFSDPYSNKYPDFEYCQCCSCTYAGILLQDSPPIINYCNISFNGNTGIRCFGDSDPILGYNTIDSTGKLGSKKSVDSKSGPPQIPSKGVLCSGTSCPIACEKPFTIGHEYERGHNVITNNGTYGIRSFHPSYPLFGTSSLWGYNSIHDHYTDVSMACPVSGCSDSLYAIGNYWYSGGPDTSKIFGPVLCSPCIPDSGGGTKNTDVWHGLHSRMDWKVKERKPMLDKFIPRGKNLNPDLSTAGDYIELGTLFLLEMHYDEAISAFQYVLDHFPDQPEAEYALVHLAHCYQEAGYNADIIPALDNLFTGDYSSDLKHLARYMSISQLAKGGLYEQSLNRCQDLLVMNCSERREKELRFEKALLYRYGLEDKPMAIRSFQDVIRRYPEDDLACIARVELEIMGFHQTQEVDLGAKMVTSSASLPERFILCQNYPNPFNAHTSIQYELPEATTVTLNVYNILGQKVRTLVDAFHIAGRYKTTWDGRDTRGVNVASGIYFIRLEANSFTQTKKMVLLK
jgi:tetratricopeptide (TPR) repeat protein